MTTTLIRVVIQGELHSIFGNLAAFSHISNDLLNIPHARDFIYEFPHDFLGLNLSFDVILEDILVEKQVEAAWTEEFLEVLHELLIVLAVVVPAIYHQAIENLLARGMLVVLGVRGELLELHFHNLGGVCFTFFSQFLFFKAKLFRRRLSYL